MDGAKQTTDTTSKVGEQSLIKIICDGYLLELPRPFVHQACPFLECIADEPYKEDDNFVRLEGLDVEAFIRVHCFMEIGDYATVDGNPEAHVLTYTELNSITGAKSNIHKHVKVLNAASYLMMPDLAKHAAAKLRKEMELCKTNDFIQVVEEIYDGRTILHGILVDRPILDYATLHLDDLMKVNEFRRGLKSEQCWQHIAAHLVKSLAKEVKRLKSEN